MLEPIKVENQMFTFGNEWESAFKYDDSKFFKEGPLKLNGKGDHINCPHCQNEFPCPVGTKSMDIVAIHKTNGIFLIEVKDFRGYRIKNKMRISRGEVAVEIALKARDTIAGLIGAARKKVIEFDSAAMIQLAMPDKKLSIVLWLEDDLEKNEKMWKETLGNIKSELKPKLRWLTYDSWVQNRTSNRIPNLTVTDLPGAGQS